MPDIDKQSMSQRLKSYVGSLSKAQGKTSKVLRFVANQMENVVKGMDAIAKSKKLFSEGELTKLSVKVSAGKQIAMGSLKALSSKAMMNKLRTLGAGIFGAGEGEVTSGSPPTGPPRTNENSSGTVKPSGSTQQEQQNDQQQGGGGGGGGGILGGIASLLSFIPQLRPVGMGLKAMAGGGLAAAGSAVAGRAARALGGRAASSAPGVVGSMVNKAKGVASTAAERAKSRFDRSIELMNERREKRRAEIAEEKERLQIQDKKKFQTGMVGKILLALGALGFAFKTAMDLGGEKILKGIGKGLLWLGNGFMKFQQWMLKKVTEGMVWAVKKGIPMLVKGLGWVVKNVLEGVGRATIWAVKQAFSGLLSIGKGITNLPGNLARGTVNLAGRAAGFVGEGITDLGDRAGRFSHSIFNRMTGRGGSGSGGTGEDDSGGLEKLPFFNLVDRAATGIASTRQYWNRNNATLIDRLRFAQYGYARGQRSHYHTLFKLEGLLQPLLNETTVNGEISVSLRSMSAEIEHEVLNIFSLNHERPEDEEHIVRLRRWLNGRFMPVFLKHHEALRKNTSMKDFRELDKLVKPLLRAYLEDSVPPASVWDTRELPLKGTPYTDGDAVLEAALRNTLMKGLPPRPAAQGEVSEETTGTETSSTRSFTREAVRAALSGGATGILARFAEQANKQTEKAAGGVSSRIMSLFGRIRDLGTAMVDPTGALRYLDRRTLHGLVTRVRLAQYGLGESQVIYLRRILALEHFLMPLVEIKSSGPYTLKKLNQVQTAEVMKILGVVGLDDDSPSVTSVTQWFNTRFIPVFLDHIKAIKTFDAGKTLLDIDKLSPIQLHGYISSIQQEDSAYSITELQIGSISFELVGLDYVTRLIRRVIIDLEKITSSQAGNAQFDEENASVISRGSQTTPVARTPVVPPSPTRPRVPGTGSASNQAELQALRERNVSINAARSTTHGEGEPEPLRPPTSPDGLPAVSRRIRKAVGELYPGGSREGLTFGPKTDFDGINPEFRSLIEGMSAEYFALTGKKLYVGEALRSSAEQARLYNDPRYNAAPPGRSLHEMGLAVDTNTDMNNELEQMGLLAKYGLTRPVGKEPWHIEPIGVSMDPFRMRDNPGLRTPAVTISPGKGGGGHGTLGNSVGSVVRNVNFQKAIYASHPDNVEPVEHESLLARSTPPTATSTPVALAPSPAPASVVRDVSTPQVRAPSPQPVSSTIRPRGTEPQPVASRAVTVNQIASRPPPQVVPQVQTNTGSVELSFYARQQLDVLNLIHGVLTQVKDEWKMDELGKVIAEAMPSVGTEAETPTRGLPPRKQDLPQVIEPPTEQMSVNAVSLRRR